MGARIGLDARMLVRVPNGLGTYARALVDTLTGLDSEHSYIVIRRPDSGPPIAVRPHVREVVMSGDPTTPTFGREISRLGLDLYHSLHHFLPIGLRVPRVVVTVHDLIWLEHRDLIRSGPFARFTRRVTQLYGRSAMGHALHRADRIIAISEHTASRAVAYFGLDPSRFDVVHHGVAHARFPAAIAARRDGSPAPYFLCLGNSRPYKNIPTALHAFAICSRDRPDVRLVVAGRGDLTAELKRLARQLDISERVTFTGLVGHEELLTLLHGAMALVFPSHIEGFGLPVLEAMAAGCPVISSTCPTLVEITGGAALLCDPSSPAAFAAAMRRVLDDAALRDDLERRGIARAAAFTWDNCARRTLSVYDTLLGVADRRHATPV